MIENENPRNSTLHFSMVHQDPAGMIFDLVVYW